MKNEILVRAIGEIDDVLIADAHAEIKKVRFPLQRITAFAAAMLLFFGSIFYLKLPGSDMTVNGIALADAPISLQIATPFALAAEPPFARQVDVLTVSIGLDLHDATMITATDGSFQLMRDGTVLYSGDRYTICGTVTVEWAIRTSDPTRTYLLTVGNTDISLYLDPATECWCIQKN